MTIETNSQTGAEDVKWNLSDLYENRTALEHDLEQIPVDAETFAGAYRGRLADLDAPGLADALQELEQIHDKMGRVYAYAYLNWSTNTEDAARGALLQRVRELYSRVSQSILFFDLEWIQVPDDRATILLNASDLASWRHYLEVQRLMKPYVLSEPEEKILSEKSVTGRSAWVRYFDEMLGAARFRFRDADLTEQEVLARLHDIDRDVRRDAAISLTGGLQDRLRGLTFVFNTVLADKASDDRRRGYPSWLASRNLSNEISDEMVDALVNAVTERYDLVARYYRLKKRLLKLDEMYDYDRYAPVGETDRRYSWADAREIVHGSYADFHGRIGDIVGEFFTENWIDAAVTPGKRGGAFSHGTVPSAHPYILMNYTGKIRDVQTLAHELGHGVHQYLSRAQGVFQSDTPLTTAETASVFGEMLVFHRMIEAESDPAIRLSMLAGKIDDTVATVFRQVSMNRFEDRIHTARRQQGELSSDQFGELWMQTQTAMYLDSVSLGDHYRIWWSYIPHFLHTPGYVYAYAFGELLVLALYARYQEEGAAFTDKYIELLSAGGSDWPHALVGKLGVDLEDTSFWSDGLSAIEALIAEAERLSTQK